jgi:hypothetical protein
MCPFRVACLRGRAATDDGRWYLIAPMPGQRKPYRLREKAVHDNVLRMPGEIVMLLDHEVGAHHEPVDIAEDHPQTEKLD